LQDQRALVNFRANLVDAAHAVGQCGNWPQSSQGGASESGGSDGRTIRGVGQEVDG